MAYRSSGRTGSSSRSGAAPRRSGGGNPNNALAMGAAVLVVAVVVVLLVTLKGGKKAKPVEEPVVVAQPVVPPPSTTPTKPPPPAFPPRDAKMDKIISDAKALVKTFEGPGALATRLYEESIQAKQAGKEDVWQAKLEEASKILRDIRDQWNEIVDQLPETKDYSQQEVANHYFGRENNTVNQYLKNEAAISKPLRPR